MPLWILVNYVLTLCIRLTKKYLLPILPGKKIVSSSSFGNLYLRHENKLLFKMVCTIKLMYFDRKKCISTKA